MTWGGGIGFGDAGLRGYPYSSRWPHTRECAPTGSSKWTLSLIKMQEKHVKLGSIEDREGIGEEKMVGGVIQKYISVYNSQILNNKIEHYLCYK